MFPFNNQPPHLLIIFELAHRLFNILCHFFDLRRLLLSLIENVKVDKISYVPSLCCVRIPVPVLEGPEDDPLHPLELLVHLLIEVAAAVYVHMIPCKHPAQQHLKLLRLELVGQLDLSAALQHMPVHVGMRVE